MGVCIKPILEPNENLAYILGVMNGDGYAQVRRAPNTRKNRYQVRLRNKSFEFTASFKYALEKIGLHPIIFVSSRCYKDRRYFELDASSKLFVEWYKSLSITDLEKLMSKDELAISFIRGFYESDGCFFYKTGTRRGCLEIYKTSKPLIDFINLLLFQLGFSPKISSCNPRKEKWNVCYRLRLYRQAEIQKFFELIHPCIKNPTLGG